MIELLVAIFIITAALVAVVTLVTLTVRSQISSEETVIAYNLAREGVEMARALRDKTFTKNVQPGCCSSAFRETLLTGTSDHAGAFLTEVPSTTQRFYFNYSSLDNTFNNAGNQVCFNSGSGLYYSQITGCAAGDTLTRFRRRIDLDYICLDPATNQECIATAPQTCASSTGSCPLPGERFVGHRVTSWVEIQGRRGPNKAIKIEDYLYAWK